MSLLIKNGYALLPQTQGTKQTDILIEGNTISRIGNIDRSSDIEEVLDASNKLVIPGLINAHTHVSMTLFRGCGENLELHEWLEKSIWPLEAGQKKEEVKAAAELAFCEMIRSGTTAFADMCIFDTLLIFQAAAKIGIRGISSRCVLDFDKYDFGQTKKLLKDLEKTIKYGRTNKLVKPSIGAHAPHTCSEELLIKSKELAKKHKLRYQIHVSETRREIFEILKKRGKYPYEYLNSLGLMDRHSIFAHGGWLTKCEIALAGKQKLNMASCPVSNLKLATGGIAQLTELDAAGVNVVLGTDSVASNNSLNMFETMKFASLLQKHHYWKANAIPTRCVFDFATINGAKALGFNSGIIEEGKLADLVLLERLPNLCPVNDIIANIVYSAGPQNVTDVIIDGNIVMKNREILTIREQAVILRSERAFSNMMGRT